LVPAPDYSDSVSINIFKPQRSETPSIYGKALAPVWEIFGTIIKPHPAFMAVPNARLQMDTTLGILRVVSADTLHYLCEVSRPDPSDAPVLKINRKASTTHGITPEDQARIVTALDPSKVTPS
jgi:hypothetical protein